MFAELPLYRLDGDLSPITWQNSLPILPLSIRDHKIAIHINLWPSWAVFYFNLHINNEVTWRMTSGKLLCLLTSYFLWWKLWLSVVLRLVHSSPGLGLRSHQFLRCNKNAAFPFHFQWDPLWSNSKSQLNVLATAVRITHQINIGFDIIYTIFCMKTEHEPAFSVFLYVARWVLFILPLFQHDRNSLQSRL